MHRQGCAYPTTPRICSSCRAVRSPSPASRALTLGEKVPKSSPPADQPSEANHPPEGSVPLGAPRARAENGIDPTTPCPFRHEVPVVFGTHPQLSHEDLREIAQERTPFGTHTDVPRSPPRPVARHRLGIDRCHRVQGRHRADVGLEAPPRVTEEPPPCRAHPHRGKRDLAARQRRLPSHLAPIRAAGS